jgi:predicted DNA binding CopG/RHH family protein
MTDKPETRGRKALPSPDKLVTVTLRLLPREIEAIKTQASTQGIGEGEWKRLAIRAALLPPAGSA